MALIGDSWTDLAIKTAKGNVCIINQYADGEVERMDAM